MQLIGLQEVHSHIHRKDYMKAINIQYFDLDSNTQAPYATWDLQDNDENIIVPKLVTHGEAGDSQKELDESINKVIGGYL